MKYALVAVSLVLCSLTAWAVSLDFPQFTAVEIGEVEVVSLEGTTETTVTFSGAGLLPLFNLLPVVFDGELGKDSETLRGFDIFSTSEKSISQKLNFQCVKEEASDNTKCTITVTKGVIAG